MDFSFPRLLRAAAVTLRERSTSAARSAPEAPWRANRLEQISRATASMLLVDEVMGLRILFPGAKFHAMLGRHAAGTSGDEESANRNIYPGHSIPTQL